tara:strand:- start:3114 stop:3563 length:450 start_codon:yes stop_codon:yes gene_type:complete
MKDVKTKITISLKLDGVKHYIKTEKLFSLTLALVSLRSHARNYDHTDIKITDLKINMHTNVPTELEGQSYEGIPLNNRAVGMRDNQEIITLISFYDLTALHHAEVFGAAQNPDLIKGVNYIPDKPPVPPTITTDFTLNDIFFDTLITNK